MSAPIPMLTVTPSGAASAYARTTGAGDPADRSAPGAGLSGDQGFGAALSRAIEGAVSAGKGADVQSIRAIDGGGNLTEVATAVSRAELALQGVVAIRDKVVAAYQDVMRMPI